MPTLDFKGKPFVYSHHLSVPFRGLEIDTKKSMPSSDGPSLDDNLIIHGDNLHGLKALLPKYAGKVDVCQRRSKNLPDGGVKVSFTLSKAVAVTIHL